MICWLICICLSNFVSLSLVLEILQVSETNLLDTRTKHKNNWKYTRETIDNSLKPRVVWACVNVSHLFPDFEFKALEEYNFSQRHIRYWNLKYEIWDQNQFISSVKCRTHPQVCYDFKNRSNLADGVPLSFGWFETTPRKFDISLKEIRSPPNYLQLK